MQEHGWKESKTTAFTFNTTKRAETEIECGPFQIMLEWHIKLKVSAMFHSSWGDWNKN